MEIDVLAVHWRSRESFAVIRFNGDWPLVLCAYIKTVFIRNLDAVETIWDTFLEIQLWAFT